MNSKDGKREIGYYYEDEIDLFEYVAMLGRYWKRLLLISIAGGILAYLFLSFTAKPPAAYIELNLGTKSIALKGEYPDGSPFLKSDLLNKEMLGSLYRDVEGLSLIDADAFLKSFRVEPIYPNDILSLKNSLERERENLSPREIASKYEMLINYHPVSYTIRFQPPERVRREVIENMFKKMVAIYSDKVVSTCSALIRYADGTNIDMKGLDNPDIYAYFFKKFQNLSGYLGRFANGQNGNGGLPVAVNDFIGERLTPLENSLNDKFLYLENKIYDQLALKHPDIYRGRVMLQVKTIESKIKLAEREGEFRKYLVELPNRLPVADILALKDNAKSSSVKSSITDSLMPLLLSFNKQYYSIMDEAAKRFDKKAELESRLDMLKDRLKRIDIAMKQNKKRDGQSRLKEVELLFNTVEKEITSFAIGIDTIVTDYYVKYQPPVKRYFITQGRSRVSYKYIVVAMVLFFGMAAFLQISVVSYQEWKKNKVKAGSV